MDAVIAREQFHTAERRAPAAGATRRYRRNAILAGSLFIIGDVAGVLSLVANGSTLEGPGLLAKVAGHPTQLTIGALLVLVMGLALALIPVVLYPVFTRVDRVLAIGTVVFRSALETVCYMATAATTLLLVELGREYTSGSAGAGAGTLGELLISSGSVAAWLTAIVFSLGSLLFYFLFYRSRLVPRWLSVWGLVGAVLYLATPLLDMFGHGVGLLMAPLAVAELVIAVWLIVKGLDEKALEELAA